MTGNANRNAAGICWEWLGSAAVVLVVALAGCGGGGRPTPPSDATDEPLSGKQVGEVTAAVNDALTHHTEADPLSAPLGAEVRNCRTERDLSADSLIAPVEAPREPHADAEPDGCAYAHYVTSLLPNFDNRRG